MSNHNFKIGDFVRLTYSNNPYIIIGKTEVILKIVEETSLPNVFSAEFKGKKYLVHTENIKPCSFVEKEKVSFT